MAPDSAEFPITARIAPCTLRCVLGRVILVRRNAGEKYELDCSELPPSPANCGCGTGGIAHRCPCICASPHGWRDPVQLWLRGCSRASGIRLSELTIWSFVIGIGLAASFLSRGLAMPAIFRGRHPAGHRHPPSWPSVCRWLRVVISASVLLLGVMIFVKRSQPLAIWASLFVVAGIFHGYAYGEAIIGAEATPLVSYLAGFAITQYLIAGAAFLIAVKAQECRRSQAGRHPPRRQLRRRCGVCLPVYRRSRPSEHSSRCVILPDQTF